MKFYLYIDQALTFFKKYLAQIFLSLAAYLPAGVSAS